MALNLAKKKVVVSEVTDFAQQSMSVVAAEYRGLNVGEMTQLRRDARAAGVFLRVVRNTLARRALADTPYACLSESLVGPLILAFSTQELNGAARLLREFGKVHAHLQVKALVVDGKLYGTESLDAVASLPSKEEAIARLMATMQAPLAKLVRALAAPHTKLVRLLAAIRDKKQAQS